MILWLNDKPIESYNEIVRFRQEIAVDVFLPSVIDPFVANQERKLPVAITEVSGPYRCAAKIRSALDC
jgi:hypothetical protein